MLHSVKLGIRGVVALPVFATALFLCGTVAAQDQTFFYSGVVSSVPTDLDSQFSIGDPISGHYTFDTTASGSTAGDGSITYAFSVSEFVMDIDGYEIAMSGLSNGDISIGDGIVGTDNYTVVAFSTADALEGFSPSLHAIQLEDSTGQALSSDALSPMPFDVTGFDNPLVTIDFSNGSDLVRVEGQLRTLQVPEPESFLMLGMAGLALLRQRSRFLMQRKRN